MSAFIVENACLENIVGHLASLEQGSMEVYTRRPVEELGYDLTDPKHCLRLAKDMMQMNCEAVGARYGENAESVDYVKQVKFKPSKWGFPAKPSCPSQAYKSLCCFLYQCSEGNVPEKPLFKALQEVEHKIAADIVHSLPGWDALTWG
jgi:hypothetical protein